MTVTTDQPDTAAADPIESAPAEPMALQAPRPSAAPPAKQPVPLGVMVNDLDKAFRLSVALSKSGEMVPKAYRNNAEATLAAILYGAEVGLLPMQALQSIAVIGGKPSLWGDAFLGVIIASPLYQDHDEYYEVGGERREYLTAADLTKDDTAAVCTFWRRGRKRPITRAFSIAQAKTAQKWNSEGPWRTYPDRQLRMRARGFAGRDAFPDLLRGIKTAEELLDIDAIDAQPIDVQDAPPPPVAPRRLSTQPQPPPAPTSTGKFGAIQFDQPPGSPTPAEPPASPTVAQQPAPAPAAPAPTEDIAQEMIRGLKVIDTKFSRRDGEPVYEITMETSTKQSRVFLTSDEQLFQEAGSFEGTDALVTVLYHVETRPGKQAPRTLILDRLSIYEGDRQQSDLFPPT